MRLDVVEQDNYDLILGRPWIGDVNLDVDWNSPSPRWKYREVDERLKWTSTEDFDELVANEPVIYAVMLIKADNGETPAVIQLPTWLLDFKDVFDEVEPKGIPNYRPQDYAIELIEGKQVPYRPIYALGEHKLNTLKTYV